MDIKLFSDKVLLKKKRDILRVYLYSKLVEHGIRPFENDMNIIIELYLFGGYNNTEQQAAFINLCISKKLKRSPQSLRNIFSKYVNNGVFYKPRNKSLLISDKFIPPMKCDKMLLQYTLGHAE